MRKVKWGIGAKIVLGYSVIILFLAFSILLVSSRMASLQREIDLISRHDLEIHNLTSQIEKLLLDMETGQRGYIITGEESYLEPYRNGVMGWEKDYKKLYSMVSGSQEQQEMLESLKGLITRWINEEGQPTIALKQQHKDQEALDSFNRDPGKPIMDQIRKKIEDFRSEKIMQTDLRADRLKQENQMLRIILVATLFVISVAAIFIAFAISNGIVKTINEVTRAIREIASSENNLTRRIEVQTSDEISELAHATNELLDNVGEMQWVNHMHTELISQHEGIFDMRLLAESFVQRMAAAVGAACAVLYIRSVEDRNTVMVRTAAYAVSSDADYGRSFKLGDGLVGQCAKDNKPILLDVMPDHYYQISSGLGESSPTSLLIAPAAFEGKVVAVMEVASLNPFSEAEKQLLYRSLETAGARINDVLSRMEIEKLLHESQLLTKELQSQSEELQTQQEEILSTNEQLAKQNQFAEAKSAELEKTQSELEEYAEQLKQSSRYKSEFLANISHELRTPLNSMLILSQMLSENSSGNMDKDEQKYASVIHSAGEELLGLINDILDLSKVEAGKLDIVMEEMSVAELPDIMEYQFTKTAEQNGLEFQVIINSDCPPFITTDVQRIHQVIRNLLSNAFKFTEEGKVVLAVRSAAEEEIEQLLPLHTGSRCLAISVSDTGIGIPKDKQSLIFEAFQQADGTTSRKYGGTGLGLSISRELAALLGGCITVDSDTGRGSVFTVYLPDMAGNDALFASREQAAAASEIVDEHPAAAYSPFNRIKGKKVLITDDDERNLFALQQTLIREGLQVITARNGRQAINRLEEEDNVELVLMDIMMPVMDGYAAMREIRANPAFKHLPIIAITAKAMKQDRDHCMEAGASDYISKPLEPKQLLSLMYVWLTKQDQV